MRCPQCSHENIAGTKFCGEHRRRGTTYDAQLRLDVLPPEGARVMLEDLLGPDPALLPLKSTLIERTEGNPFFLEESVRTLVETGAVTGSRGAYHRGASAPTVQVPATVQAMLAARIDRLAEDDKALLQTAAVVGKDVPVALLRSIAGLGDTELDRGLARLQAAEFLYATHAAPEHAYTFKHERRSDEVADPHSTWWHRLPHRVNTRSTPQWRGASHGPYWHRRAQEGKPSGGS